MNNILKKFKNRRKNNMTERFIDYIYEEHEETIDNCLTVFILLFCFLIVPAYFYMTNVDQVKKDYLESKLKYYETDLVNYRTLYDYADTGWYYDRETKRFLAPVANSTTCFLINYNLKVKISNYNSCGEEMKCCLGTRNGDLFVSMNLEKTKSSPDIRHKFYEKKMGRLFYQPR